VRPLLFERLTEAGPDAAPPRAQGRPLGRAEVEASVMREVGALLNTRIAKEVDAIDPRERTVVDYGLPDFSGKSAASDTDRTTIARAAERAIRAFEPRLGNPKVTAVATSRGRDAIEFSISGTLTVNEVPELHLFTLAMTDGGGDAD
jgi:type VI secretion system lysozyme-like protein